MGSRESPCLIVAATDLNCFACRFLFFFEDEDEGGEYEDGERGDVDDGDDNDEDIDSGDDAVDVKDAAEEVEDEDEDNEYEEEDEYEEEEDLAFGVFSAFGVLKSSTEAIDPGEEVVFNSTSSNK